MTRPRTVHAGVAQYAAQAPDAIALLTGDDGISYGCLDAQANRLARWLESRGVAPGSFVATLLPRSPEAVTTFLAILKTGAAFVPLDAGYPAELLRFILQDSAPALVIADPALLQEVGGTAEWRAPIITTPAAFAASAQLDAGPLPDRGTGDDVAYMMYTSGSTGRPKGVLTPHRGILRLCIDNGFAAFGADEVFLQLAPLAFDAATLEIWACLLNGARLAFVAGAKPSLDEIGAAIARHGVTTMWMTSGLFHLMVDQRLDALRPLRRLLAGGDVLSPEHCRRVVAALPGLTLINGYGPTENTTFTCCHEIPRDLPPGRPVPIGRPIAGTQCHVLDDALRPVPDGEEGQLCVSGEGVALGYWRRPELTAEKFVPNLFGQDGGERLYLTGDLVRRRPDGVIEFIGRIDGQVKINGRRIETGEIEAVLRRHTAVHDAVVTARDEPGGKRLVAYVVPPVDAAALKTWLAAQLPDWMLPSAIVGLAMMPLTPNGKVDRRALPAPPAGTAASPWQGVTGSPLEGRIRAIWQRVLHTQNVELTDNFFDLGGSSLQLMAVHAELVRHVSPVLDVVTLFRFPTIAGLAAHLAQADGVGRASVANDRAARQTEMLRRLRDQRTRRSS
ncbi:Non-ribosomal peptide synthetase [Rhodovastum atsumiense]|nr:non-ribosomal peptide synthetase [Rhodovastum atsumiense]CAH2601473.1 Non-ribosomal peptide synthetase [Rhodovastum atsumiense]